MWKVFSGLQRATLGSFRGSLREDHQKTGQSLTVLQKSGNRSLTTVPQFSVFQACERSEQTVCLSTRKDLNKVSRKAAPLLYSSHNNQQNKGRNDYVEPWSFAEVFQFSAILALSFSLLHDKNDLCAPDLCPVYAIKCSKSALAQPLEDKSSATAPLPSSRSIQNLHNVAESVGDPQGFHDSDSPLVESDGEACCSWSSGSRRGQPHKLGPGAEFKVEIDSIEAINLLESGSPRGIAELRRQSRRGSSVASFYLGMAYEQGYLVDQNLAAARSYYELSAASGNPEAQFNLAIFHLEGRGGLKRSEEKGRDLLEKAAAGGLQAARAALGLHEGKEESGESNRSGKDLYMLGRSFEDLGEKKAALDFYTLSAEAGYSKAGRALQRLTSASTS